MEYELRQLDLSLKPKIDMIKDSSSNISAATNFLSMYMWRGIYGSQIVVQDGMYALKNNEENTWFFPTGDENGKINFISEMLKRGNLRFVFATDEDCEFLKKYFSDCFEICEKIDDSEYLYSVEQYRTLESSSFRKIRYEIKQVGLEAGLECIELTQDNAYMVEEIISDWVEKSDDKGDFSIRRDGFDRSIFKDVSGNGIKGIILTQNGAPIAAMAGVFVGEKIYSVFLGEHKRAQNGMVAYLMHKMSQVLPPEIEFINMEEDLGIEGLRFWKNKMHPIDKINMWECIQK